MLDAIHAAGFETGLVHAAGSFALLHDATARLDLAARRIVFGKLLNCGQTCVAPDYLLIDRRVKDAFLERAEYWIHRLYGRNPLDNQGRPHDQRKALPPGPLPH